MARNIKLTFFVLILFLTVRLGAKSRQDQRSQLRRRGRLLDPQYRRDREEPSERAGTFLFPLLSIYFPLALLPSRLVRRERTLTSTRPSLPSFVYFRSPPLDHRCEEEEELDEEEAVVHPGGRRVVDEEKENRRKRERGWVELSFRLDRSNSLRRFFRLVFASGRVEAEQEIR